MLVNLAPNFLVASPEPKFLRALEPLLAEQGGKVHIGLSAEAAFGLLTAQEDIDLLLLDANLPGLDLGQFLATAQGASRRVPIVLISDTIPEQSLEWLAEGLVDDIVPGSLNRPLW